MKFVALAVSEKTEDIIFNDVSIETAKNTQNRTFFVNGFIRSKI